ncbi:polysaccharide deacetylase family protein [Aeromicrobium sp. Leaf350]|uniref:polysaccharide deacetylase family protein n=1 Tax=Aeromicrobium sp. Leaf350 TaxID=2876565 RepID=UPI001E3DBFAE|nr:polysaccharide deacetylase family protein [Aeromicrobium sp. Leaf350]
MRTSARLAGQIVSPAARVVSPVRGLTMLGWHRIGDAPDGLTTSFDDLRRHLDAIEGWGATVLPLLEAVRRRADGTLPSRSVVLTFDDGYASVVEKAWPELRERGLPATLYAVSGYLEAGRRFPWDHEHAPDADLTRLVTASELQDAAADGLDIGSHTVTHRWLPGLRPADAAEEVHRSRVELEDLLQQPVLSFSYPMGGVTPEIRAEAERAGYLAAVTTERGRNGRRQDPLTLRRAFAFDRADDFQRQLDGAYTWMRVVERTRRHRVPRW